MKLKKQTATIFYTGFWKTAKDCR